MQVAAPAVPIAVPAGASNGRTVMASVVQQMPIQNTAAPVRKTYGSSVDVSKESTGPEFDRLTGEANRLAAADATLATARSQQEIVLRKLPETEKKRLQAENEVHTLEKRINNNETNPVFKWSVMQPQTWFSGGVPAKIAGLQEELATWQGRVNAVVAAERELNEQKTSLERQMPKLEEDAAKKASASAKAVAIFEAAVHTYPSPTLQAFEQNQEQWKSAVAFERINTRSLMEVLQSMEQAREAYYNSMRALQSAMGMNQGAQVMNVMGGRRRPGMEMMENMQEMRRNRLMQEAGHMAEMGGQMLVSAFQHIPAAARARYPELCREFGTVHVPSIEQMGLGATMLNLFGGQMVDFAVNMGARRKIQESMGRLQECEQLVARQEAMCQALLAAIHRDGSAAAANLRTVNEQVWAEKVNVFNALRTTNGLRPAAASAFTTAFEKARQTGVKAEESSYMQHRAAVQVQRHHRGRGRAQPMYDDGMLW